MRQLSLILLPLLALTACDPDSEPVGQSEGGGTDSGSDSDSGDSGPGSTGGASASDFETSPATSDSATTLGTSTTGGMSSTGDPSGSGESGGCEEADCAECPEGTTSEQYCDGDTWICDCVPLGDVCDLPTYVDEAAAGKTVPEDCGTVTLDDPDEAYVAAHDCVAAASTAQQAYRLVAQLQGIDPSVWVGYAGTVGFVYSESNFFYDGGGLAGGGFIWRDDCTPEPIDDCAPSSSNGVCFECKGENTLVCSDPGE